MKKLNRQIREIMVMNGGFLKTQKVEQICSEFNITHEQVHQLVLARLRFDDNTEANLIFKTLVSDSSFIEQINTDNRTLSMFGRPVQVFNY